MIVKIKLLGRYKDITGEPEISLEIKSGDTIWDVVEVFIKKYPIFKKDKNLIMVSKNNTYTTLDTKFSDGDQITLTPPVVSGG